jgi:hypothetical protein
MFRVTIEGFEPFWRSPIRGMTDGRVSEVFDTEEKCERFASKIEKLLEEDDYTVTITPFVY